MCEAIPCIQWHEYASAGVTPIPELDESTIWLPINGDDECSRAFWTACAKVNTLEHLHILAGSTSLCFQRAQLRRLHNLIFASFWTTHVEIDSEII